MDKDTLEKFVRWTDYRIQQLSFSNNLFIALSVASIGFLISEKPIDYCAKMLIVILLSLSLFAGIAATITRLYDFKYTVKKIRSKDPSYKKITDSLGCATWALFHVQVILYVVASISFLFCYIF